MRARNELRRQKKQNKKQFYQNIFSAPWPVLSVDFSRYGMHSFTHQKVSLLFVDGNCQFEHLAHHFISLGTLKELRTLFQQIHQVPLIRGKIAIIKTFKQGNNEDNEKTMKISLTRHVNCTTVYRCSIVIPSSVFITLSSATTFGETLANAAQPSL